MNNKLKNNEEVSAFCERHNITLFEYYGEEKISGYLYLRSLTSIPEGFNPTVGGYLDLSSLTSIPEGFNPTVGGSLYLRSLTSIPEGFKKENFEYMNVPEIQETKLIKWGNGKGSYIYCDGRFSEVISQRNNVWKLKDVNKDNEYYLVTDNHGNYSHGDSIKEAKEDFIYKVSSRDKSEFADADIEEKIPFEKCIQMYRVITGACSTGVKNFITGHSVPRKKYSIKQMAKVTSGQYGNSEFKSFFKIK